MRHTSMEGLEMSVRKRTWTTSKGEIKTAWVLNYTDGAGKRRLKTFDTKKEASAEEKRIGVALEEGTHVPDTASITVKEAGKLWMESGKAAGLERTTLDQRRQHLEEHIEPF